MPELPEVETTRRGIAPHLTGRTVVRLHVRESRLRWPVPETLAARIEGRTVDAVERRGKYLLVQFAHGTLIVHLGMSGSLRVLDQAVAPARHDHIDLEIDDGRVLRFNDPRRFGAWLWAADWHNHPLLAGLGPEPLSRDFDGRHLYALSRQRKVAIKDFIMNARVVVGVGNIYANEALFLSGIDPRRAAGRVGLQRMESLAGAIREVLENAIAAGGTTLRDFVNSEGKPGYFHQSLLAYGRQGLPCKQCGRPLRQARLGQRSTVFCCQCQH